MDRHPTLDEIRSFLEGKRRGRQVSPGDRRLTRHLLGNCSVCQARIREIRDSHRHSARDPKGLDYENAFGKAERAFSLFVSDGGPVQEPPGDLLAEIVLLADEGISLPSENRFSIPLLIRWLVERSHAFRYRDPEKVLELALLARLAADACSTEVAGSPARLADLRCRAWGQLGNALRICSRLTEAEEILSKSQEYCASGTGDPLLRGLVFEWLAPLHYFERRWTDARQVIKEAEAIYEDFGEDQLLPRARIQSSIFEIECGEPAKALSLLRGTIPLLGGEEPYLLVAAYHNLARCYIDLGRPDEALSLSSATRSLTQSVKEPLIRARLAWQDGRIFQQLGDLKAAEAAFLRARQEFASLDLIFEVTLITHHLASVYLEMGAVDKLERSIAKTLSYCRARTISGEAKRSLEELQGIVR